MQAALEVLFGFVGKLNKLLDEEKYASFYKQQLLFDDQLKHYFKNYPEKELVDVLERLKILRAQINDLQTRAQIETKQLKEKSLNLQRNKKKIKAYK